VTGTVHSPTPTSVAAYVRNHVIDVVSDIIDECESGRGSKGLNMMRGLVGYVTGFEAVSSEPTGNGNAKDPRIVGINQDVSGRISKAVSTAERFKRWGSHYLRALVRAHQLQLNTNFMDEGLQCYGGTLFKSLRDFGGKTFVTLPIKKKEDYARARAASTTKTTTTPIRTTTPIVTIPTTPPSTAIDNTTYYQGSGGGCFDETCTVQILSSENSAGIPTLMKNVKKDDLVRVVDDNGNFTHARVLCVVKIERRISGELVEFQKCGLKITPRHPIKIGGLWRLPKDFLGDSVTNFLSATNCKSTSKFVYNFVLDRCHILLVNGIECVTFGHGIQDPVTWHPFYASRDVVHCVSSLPGFSDGIVSTNESLHETFKRQHGIPLPIKQM